MMYKKVLIKVLSFIIIVLTVAVIVGFVGPFVYWYRLNSIPLKTFILDKTVPQKDYREHKGLMWILNHQKIVDNKTGNSYRYDKDYYGFFPNTKNDYDIIDLPLTAQQPDLVYLADTYGVFRDDYLEPNEQGARSPLMYGGFLEDDIRSVGMQLGNGNTLIGEFNIASSPTLEDVRLELGKFFGVNWNGWKGRYFLDLLKNVEVPDWLVADYELQYNKKWEFQGGGFVFINDEDKVYVLEEGKHFGNKSFKISFNEAYKKEFSVNGEIPYYYWFEFIQPDPNVEVIANYSFTNLTIEGQKILTELGLPNTFPAIVRQKNNDYTSYYLAGDFADMKNITPFYNYYGYASIMQNISLDVKGDNINFFWRCYAPFMKKVLSDIEYKKGGIKQ